MDINSFQDSLDQVLTNLVNQGKISDNQRLLIYLDLAQNIRSKINIQTAKKRIEDIANYTKRKYE